MCESARKSAVSEIIKPTYMAPTTMLRLKSQRSHSPHSNNWSSWSVSAKFYALCCFLPLNQKGLRRTKNPQTLNDPLEFLIVKNDMEVPYDHPLCLTFFHPWSWASAVAGSSCRWNDAMWSWIFPGLILNPNSD